MDVSKKKKNGCAPDTNALMWGVKEKITKLSISSR